MGIAKFRALLAGLCAAAGMAPAAAEELAPVVVSASRLRDQAQVEVPASVSVLSAEQLRVSAQQHFEEVISQAPNLHWAAGSSRARYFQIRGIGEREQYQGAPNPSVGFLIDDIDFSGVGMAATIFDIDQVEVLRGPQGTRLGANALAGLIAMRSAVPEDSFHVRTSAQFGNYDTGSLGASLTGPLEGLDSAWRLAVQRYRSDGFRKNAYLQREDTNGRDELTVRGKWRWEPSEGQRVDITLLHANLDNAYDAFSIDNSRVTLSDAPGEDSQRAEAVALKWQGDFSAVTLTTIATVLDSTSVHAYDGDWGNPQSWLPYDYDFVYRAGRERQSKSFELRVGSPGADVGGSAWLVGWHFVQLRERIDERSFSNSFALDEFLISDYEALNAAMFAQLEGKLHARVAWTLGVRGETRTADYRDRGGGTVVASTLDSARDGMVGGQATLSFEVAEQTRLYAAVSRGYKAGGFNLGQARARQESFAPEFLWNYELGFKMSADEWYTDMTAFYMRREDMQVRSGAQLEVGNPNSFAFVTQNVARGYNYGIEASVRWRPMRELEVGASAGWLRTQQSGALGEGGEFVAPRDQAHAPSYQLQLNATYRHASGWMGRIDASALDGFYFDVPTDHDQRAEGYELVNVRLGYEAERWSAFLWGRNVFDTRYATRGFYFGNEPPNYENKLYIQNGDPRTYGVGVEWEW